MKICINCGVELEDNAIFCEECGIKQIEQKKFCSNCGAELSANNKFCMECGTPVATDNIAPAPIQMPSPTTAPIHTASCNNIEEVTVSQPDNSTITVVIKGVTFNLKLVGGKDYGTNKEITDFFIGETTVTQALWFTLMNDNPSVDNSDINLPVTNIDPSIVASFLLKLQKLTGVRFELPTRAQWDYAYKGGKNSKGYKYSGSDDVTEVGWSDRKLHPVGELFPNELGITDMEGNVEELLKGNEWAFISTGNKNKLKDNNLSGLRVVVNIPVDTIIDNHTPLQSIISEIQTEVLSYRENALNELRRKEEDRIKAEAEEEARKNAEKEAKRKAKEEAERLKAEEEARKNAEREAKRQAQKEARQLKAEEDARRKAEKVVQEKAEGKIRRVQLEQQLPELQEKDTELKKELEACEQELSDKKQKQSELKASLQECNDSITEVDKKGNALERRFRVILTKRVESGFFNTKGAVFDSRLIEITKSSKEQLKEWYSELKKSGHVTISDSVELMDALSWQLAIEEEGGEAEIGRDIEDDKAEELLKEYEEEYKNLCTEKAYVEDTIEKLNTEIESLENKFQTITTSYEVVHSDLKKCELEIELSSEKFIELKNQSGIYIYNKEEEDVVKHLPDLFEDSEYAEFKEREGTLLENAKKIAEKSDIVWETFGVKEGNPKCIYNEEIKYVIVNNDTLILKGDGIIPDISNSFPACYNEWHLGDLYIKGRDIKYIIILGNVTRIGKYSFYNFYRLRAIVLPETVKSIGNDAFWKCSNLRYITLPENLELIAESAFRDCDLQYVHIPGNVQKICSNTFDGNNNLKIALLPKTAEFVIKGEYASFPKRLKVINK